MITIMATAADGPKATLELRDDGSLEDMASEYFENTECASSAYVSNSQAAENLSLSDLAGVFLVLGVFIVLSFTVWISRTSLPDKRTCKRYSTQRAAVTAEKEEEVNSRSSEWEVKASMLYRPRRFACLPCASFWRRVLTLSSSRGTLMPWVSLSNSEGVRDVTDLAETPCKVVSGT